MMMVVLIVIMMMILVIKFEFPRNGFDTNVNEGDACGDSNNGCGDGDFDDLILSVLILFNTLKSNIYISFS